ncbi:tetratricopeptide repeat protein 19, mitochondrial isoform X2 [Ambystoma mexicanum]|uniref:tetratricopeptide repeat protein 19, mitochondrial isoform X2 n=1 Tax=Ambystoma mexicanum TaxID=8296 RepID=UPI0037E9C4E0
MGQTATLLGSGGKRALSSMARKQCVLGDMNSKSFALGGGEWYASWFFGDKGVTWSLGIKTAICSVGEHPIVLSCWGSKESTSESQNVKHRAICCQGHGETCQREFDSEKRCLEYLSNDGAQWTLLTKNRELPTRQMRWKTNTIRNRYLKDMTLYKEFIKTLPLGKMMTNHLNMPIEGEEERWSNHRTKRTFLVGILAGFSFFSKSDSHAVEEKEKDTVTEQEDKIIFLLKAAKLSIMKGELEDAEQILHQAAHLAHKSDNKKAIIYTYDLMANLAYLRGQYDSAEKLFKAVMSYLLAADTKQDDNAFIEISLKLASIYAAQKRHDLAFAGYEFCILTLEEKTEKQKHLPEEVLTVEEKANTRLLFGLCMDSYARYLMANKKLPRAQTMCERALKISIEVQGLSHPQTVILMNDLAAVLDYQGQHDQAYTYVKKASELAQQTEHPEEHVVLSNMAAILMHQEHFEEARKVFTEALKQAEQKRDGTAIKQIQEGLTELSQRRGGL